MATFADPPSALYEEHRVPHVLLVDDDPSIRLVCSINLASAGFEVSEAGDGTSALEQALRTPPDLVLSDLRMPGLDGFELVDALRGDERTRHIPVVLLTAETAITARQRAFVSGVAGFVAKPFDPRTLVALVTNLLEQRAPASP